MLWFPSSALGKKSSKIRTRKERGTGKRTTDSKQKMRAQTIDDRGQEWEEARNGKRKELTRTPTPSYKEQLQHVCHEAASLLSLCTQCSPHPGRLTPPLLSCLDLQNTTQ
jgi:hypothetical protein